MRPSPTARIALGAALIGAVVAIALALAQDGAEAPNRIDYFGDADTDDCTVDGAIGPHLCLTDTPPTPTPDTRDQRVDLLSDPRIAVIVEAAETGDVEALVELTLKVNLCEYETRGNREACSGVDYIEAVQQPLGHSMPALRSTEMMRDWFTHLLAAGGSRLDLAVRSLPDGDLPPDAYVLIFKLSQPASVTDADLARLDHFVLYLRLDAEQPIEQFSFLASPGNPSSFLLHELDLAPISYELILGQCHSDDRFHCD
jgi:hypothetical protein